MTPGLQTSKVGRREKETQWPTATHLTDFVASCTACAQRTRATPRSGSGVWRRRRRIVRSALGERSPTRAGHHVGSATAVAWVNDNCEILHGDSAIDVAEIIRERALRHQIPEVAFDPWRVPRSW